MLIRTGLQMACSTSFSRLGLIIQVNSPSFLTRNCETHKVKHLQIRNAGHVVESYGINLGPFYIHIMMHLLNYMLREALLPTFHRTFAGSELDLL